MSPLVLSLILLIGWPLLWGVIGFNMGRKRLVIRSPIIVRRREPEAEPDIEAPDPANFAQVKKLRDRAGYGS